VEFPYTLPYLQKVADLKTEARVRKISGCRERARRHLLERFGFDLDDFTLEARGAGMWRQFFGTHFENAVVEVLCRLTGLERNDLTYLKDGFSSRNPFKNTLVKVKVAEKENGSWRIQSYRISDGYTENQVIMDIEVRGGVRSYEYHLELLERYGYGLKFTDVSDLLSEWVASSLVHLKKSDIVRVFDSLFVIKSRDGFRIRERYTPAEAGFRSKNDELTLEEMVELASKSLVLPSARSYYKAFFFFLPGIYIEDYVQFEAVFETADAYIFDPVVEGFKNCKDSTGFYPLIAPLPDFNVEKTFHFTKNPACTCLFSNIDDLIRMCGSGGGRSSPRKAQSLGREARGDFYSLGWRIGKSIRDSIVESGS